MKMNQDVKKLWVEALRSGEYKQCKQQLFYPISNSFCCLGVLCDLHIREFQQATFDGDGFYLGHDAILPTEVACWAGLALDNLINVKVVGDIEPKQLSALNDTGYGFTKIAKLIEEQL